MATVVSCDIYIQSVLIRMGRYLSQVAQRRVSRNLLRYQVRIQVNVDEQDLTKCAVVLLMEADSGDEAGKTHLSLAR